MLEQAVIIETLHFLYDVRVSD